jgi:hypothetical protein
MKRKVIFIALAIYSCSKPEPSLLEMEDTPQSYGTEDIVIIQQNGAKLISSKNSYYQTWREDSLWIYPYPNTSAPIIVESADSTKMIPSLINENTLILDLLAPGKTGIIVTSEGISKVWNINVNRMLHYDLNYDPSSDRLTLDFMQNPSYPIEEEFWDLMTAELHITMIWSYNVGFGSNYMNTRYPKTTVISGEFPVKSGITLANLEKEYKMVKELYDDEFAVEYAKDPKHDWKTWSGIELDVVIRNPEECMIIGFNKGTDSAYNYNLGFKISHTLIEN